jgi:hypothetical protein
MLKVWNMFKNGKWVGTYHSVVRAKAEVDPRADWIHGQSDNFWYTLVQNNNLQDIYTIEKTTVKE